MPMRVGAPGCRFRGRRWQRRETRHGEQKFVRGVEEVDMGIDRAVGCGHKDGSVAGVIESDIRLETSSASRLLDDVRRGISGQDVNPAKADARRLAGVVESFLAQEIGRKNVNALSGRILNGDVWTTGSKQVFEPDRHVVGCGIEAGASGGGLGCCAGSLFASADQ